MHRPASFYLQVSLCPPLPPPSLFSRRELLRYYELLPPLLLRSVHSSLQKKCLGFYCGSSGFCQCRLINGTIVSGRCLVWVLSLSKFSSVLWGFMVETPLSLAVTIRTNCSFQKWRWSLCYQPVGRKWNCVDCANVGVPDLVQDADFLSGYQNYKTKWNHQRLRIGGIK